MYCLSFGQFVVLIILLAIVSAFTPAAMAKFIGFIQFLVLAYFIAGFFVKCDMLQ